MTTATGVKMRQPHEQQFTPQLLPRLVRHVIVNQQNTLCGQIMLKIPNTSNNGLQG